MKILATVAILLALTLNALLIKSVLLLDNQIKHDSEVCNTRINVTNDLIIERANAVRDDLEERLGTLEHQVDALEYISGGSNGRK